MMAQPSGWGSTQNAAALPVVDAFARNLLMRYGGRTDDVWAFHDMPGYKQELGRARGVPGSDSSDSFSTGSGFVRITGMGKGGTPPNPGEHNYNTLKNTAGLASEVFKEGFNFLADRRLSNQGGNPNSSNVGFRFGKTPIYNTFRGKQQGIADQQRVANIRAARQQSASGAISGTTPMSSGLVSNIKNPQSPIDAANKGIMEWRKGKASSKYPNPTDPSEAANKGIGDMLREQQAKAEAARLTPAELYKANKSMRETFPNFYKNK